jgi:hypothetical protein
MLFADLYFSYSDCWHGIILRCLGVLSSPRLLVDLGPGGAHFISDYNTSLLEGSCSERANGVKGQLSVHLLSLLLGGRAALIDALPVTA